MKTNRLYVCSLLLVAAGLGACQASSNTEMSWQSPLGRAAPFTKVMVIAIEESAPRLATEDRVARRLTRQGIVATPSINLFRNLGQIDLDDFMGFVKADKIDAVITIEPFEAVEVVSETDWTVDSSADLRQVVVTGWTTTEIAEEFGVEVVIWDTKSWQPVWAGRSEVFEAETVTDDVTEFVVTSTKAHGAR